MMSLFTLENDCLVKVFFFVFFLIEEGDSVLITFLLLSGRLSATYLWMVDLSTCQIVAGAPVNIFKVRLKELNV